MGHLLSENMNTVNVLDYRQPHIARVGDLYKNKKGNVFILAHVVFDRIRHEEISTAYGYGNDFQKESYYAAISLINGYYYSDATKIMQQAVEHLEYIGNELDITITIKNK